jgi:hypothetical protein
MEPNPYAPPRAVVSDVEGRGTSSLPAEPIFRRRPILVWVICAFYVIGILVTIPTLLVLTSGAITVSPAATEYYQLELTRFRGRFLTFQLCGFPR